MDCSVQIVYQISDEVTFKLKTQNRHSECNEESRLNEILRLLSVAQDDKTVPQV